MYLKNLLWFPRANRIKLRSLRIIQGTLRSEPTCCSLQCLLTEIPLLSHWWAPFYPPRSRLDLDPWRLFSSTQDLTTASFKSVGPCVSPFHQYCHNLFDNLYLPQTDCGLFCDLHLEDRDCSSFIFVSPALGAHLAHSRHSAIFINKS